jgi:cell division protein FtsZ
MTEYSLIGLGFADIRSILKGGGKAYFGKAEATGEVRAIKAAEGAIRGIKSLRNG